eukprot:SAG31_NODE_2361_length_5869_cov_3.154246_2_plen_182_part_00
MTKRVATPGPGTVLEITEDQLLAGLDAAADNDERMLLMLLDGVLDPHNLGAILRTADGAGCGAVLMPRKGCAPIGAAVLNVARGSSVPVARIGPFQSFVKRLKKHGVYLVGTDDRAPMNLYDTDVWGRSHGHLGLVLGSEDSGLRPQTANLCDTLVQIPCAAFFLSVLRFCNSKFEMFVAS